MPNQPSPCAKILLAFQEGSALTRRDALERAKVSDPQEFNSLVIAGHLRQTAWHQCFPREYMLTTKGADRRDHYADVPQLIS